MRQPVLDEADTVPGLDFPYPPVAVPTSSTTISITYFLGTTTPTHIKYYIIKCDKNWNSIELSNTQTVLFSNAQAFINFDPDYYYKIVFTPSLNGVTNGSSWTTFVVFPTTTTVTAPAGNSSKTPTDDGDSKRRGRNGQFTPNPPGKSFLQVSTDSTTDYKIASKEFDSITLPAYTTDSSNGYITYTAPSTYHVFGTSIYLQDNKNQNGTGGIGFFIDTLGAQGYYLEIQPTRSAFVNGLNVVKLFKSNQNGVKQLVTSQNSPRTTLQEIYQMTQYNIDIYVKTTTTGVIIKAYVNNFLIEAIDTNTTVDKVSNPILKPTKRVGLMAGKSGTAYFDYVYAATIDESQYNKRNLRPNLYNGNYSNDLIDLTLGDIVYNANNSTDVLKPSAVEDFGTVAREIYYTNAKFKSRPAYPISWTSSSNDTVNILGQTRSNFSSEVYVLNNTSTTTTLNDGSASSLFVYGNVLGEAGDIEYSTELPPEYSNREPVIFKSVWIQNQADAKNLGDWIKSKIINKGNIVEMQVFGNPLLSVGDIISVKYVYQGFAGTEKMIITKITLSYNEGLETRITARTL